MVRVPVEQLAANLKALLEQVAQGEEVILLDQNRAIARLVPLQTREQWLASTRHFRDSLQLQGEPLSTTVVCARQGERD